MPSFYSQDNISEMEKINNGDKIIYRHGFYYIGEQKDGKEHGLNIFMRI